MEFNLVVCGLASFAAGVGYACTRRLSVNSSDWRSEKVVDIDERLGTTIALAQSAPISSTSQKTQFQSGRRSSSLKRKNTEDHYRDASTPSLGYPHNLNNIYPPANKRCKTPTTESPDGQEIARFEPASVQTCVTPYIDTTPQEPVELAVATPPTVLEPVVNPDEKPAGPSVPEGPLPLQGEVSPARSAPASPRTHQPQPVAAPLPDDFVLVEAPRTPTPPPPPAPKASRGFAAFASKANAFSVATSSTPPSKSIWASGVGVSPSLLFPNDNTVSVFSSTDEIDKKEPTSKPGNINYTTGEENEDLKEELKNLKLYIKRGKSDFSSEGMLGTLKLLADKSSGQERLLFRRDPLWQVSMNKRVDSTIRCVYSAGEKVLRIITSEIVPDSSEREVVIYALKASRGASKDQFEAFATLLIKNEKLTS